MLQRFVVEDLEEYEDSQRFVDDVMQTGNSKAAKTQEFSEKAWDFEVQNLIPWQMRNPFSSPFLGRG